MTEERANAGTPGPIDPRDVDALDLVYLTSLTESRMASSVLIGQVDQEALDFMDIATRELALLAVAGAVCPEHHAVFDTREYIAVEISAIKDAISALSSPTRDEVHDEMQVEMVFGWLCDLLPTESEEAR